MKDRPESGLIHYSKVMIFYPVARVTPPAYIHRVTQSIEKRMFAQAIPAVRLWSLRSVEILCQVRRNGREKINTIILSRKFVLVEIKFYEAREQRFMYHFCMWFVDCNRIITNGITHETPGQGTSIILSSFTYHSSRITHAAYDAVLV